MIYPYFTGNQIIPFFIGAILILASILTFHSGRSRTGLILLFLGSAGLSFFIANLDHFLILWDEQYHALVAKNMMTSPFKPALYSTPLLDYDYHHWTSNHVWLHKQPLFLWQIALSLKIFGISELAVRIPSIVMHAVISLMIYRIGKISCSKTVGYYGALFFAVAYYPLELVAGKYATDHNDIAFLFYVTASFWAWFEYRFSQKNYWLLLIGLFAGCAVLVKWLVGLLVYGVWIVTVGAKDKKEWLKWSSYSAMAKSILVTAMIFLPWQLFVFYAYPKEAGYEFALNTRHLFYPVENHGGNIWFHFNAIKDLYGSGDAVPFLLLLGLFILLKKCTDTIYRVAMLAAIIITYGFYTIAATKMISFCLIVSPFLFLALAALTDSILKFLQAKIKFSYFELIFGSFALIVICFFLINLSNIQNYHTDWKPHDNCNRNADVKQMEFIRRLPSVLPDGKFVIFNAGIRVNGHIPVMFYTDYIAYDFVPDREQTEKIKMQSWRIAIVETDNLPDFIMQDKNIIKIQP